MTEPRDGDVVREQLCSPSMLGTGKIADALAALDRLLKRIAALEETNVGLEERLMKTAAHNRELERERDAFQQNYEHAAEMRARAEGKAAELERERDELRVELAAERLRNREGITVSNASSSENEWESFDD